MSGPNSFWKSNSFVPSWINFFSQAWNSSPPKLLETLAMYRPSQVLKGCQLRKAAVGDVPAIIEFWGRFFSSQKSCRCVVPPTHVSTMMTTDKWEVLIVFREVTHEIIGTIVRRKIKNLHVREAKWAEAGIIDYYCVHPAWRSRGIGRALLDGIHNTAKMPMSPQLIYWEGLHPLYPPLSIGIFLSRVCEKSIQDNLVKVPNTDQEALNAWKQLKRDIWTEEAGEEISFWKTSIGIVTVWNSFHCTIPERRLIGCVIGGSPAAINSIATSTKSPWGVLIIPTNNPLTQDFGPFWNIDSPYQWLGYNLSVGFISTEFPALGM